MKSHPQTDIAFRTFNKAAKRLAARIQYRGKYYVLAEELLEATADVAAALGALVTAIGADSQPSATPNTDDA